MAMYYVRGRCELTQVIDYGEPCRAHLVGNVAKIRGIGDGFMTSFCESAREIAHVQFRAGPMGESVICNQDPQSRAVLLI